MPGGDGTGPFGTGPRWGACLGAGLRRGRGMGRGPGLGYGFGMGYPGVYPADPQSQRQVLENRKALLERELAALKGQLSENGGE